MLFDGVFVVKARKHGPIGLLYCSRSLLTIHKRHNSHRTALHFAAMDSNDNVADLLTEYGAAMEEDFYRIGLCRLCSSARW